MNQFTQPHWFQHKAIEFMWAGRRPQTVKEWVHCMYNADIFYGPIPFLKAVAVGSWLIAWWMV